ncbi:MAG: ribonuclease HI [Deltaproteobacteria bacterium]|nr:ribonuclease HI [Deltaproteobacteria bacterium]
MTTQNHILIFCDGACSGNPGPGGWGAIVCLPSEEVFELGGAASNTTNNQMELSASIAALKSIQDLDGPVKLCTDSTYVIQGITKWIYGWLQKDWKTAEGNEVSNRSLWKQLFQVASKRKGENKISWHYVRGHIGIAGNERADEIAVAFSQNKNISLYRGALKDYPLSILDLPEDTSLPNSSSYKKSKSKALCYLSLVGGKVERHNTWPECEARVKGVSSAKFKKAMSEEEEKEILKNWGA